MLLILRPLPNTAAFRRSPSSAGASLEEDTRRERSSAAANVDRAAACMAASNMRFAFSLPKFLVSNSLLSPLTP